MTEKVEPEKTEEPFSAIKDVLIEGCIDGKAKEVISQMLTKRLAELDPAGLQAKFIMKLQNEINIMADCGEILAKKEEEKPVQ